MRVTESENLTIDAEPSNKKNSRALGRRGFLKGAASAAVVSVIIPLEPLVGGKESEAGASVASYAAPNRANKGFEIRKAAAINEKLDLGVLPDNGDNALFSDHSGNWSKCLQHDDLGIVNQSRSVKKTHPPPFNFMPPPGRSTSAGRPIALGIAPAPALHSSSG